MKTATPHRSPRTRAIRLLLLAVALALPASAAFADDVADARAAFDAGHADAARAALLDWLLAEPTDPTALLDAAHLARDLDDLDLLERVQGRAEISAEETPDPRLDLALAVADEAIASGRLARGMQGQLLAQLFSDAETKAKAVLDDPALGAEARVLLARTRRAVGDLDGALAALEGGDLAPEARAWRGRLHYERSVAREVDAQGRPTEAGRAELQAALDDLAAAGDELGPKDRFQARITAAWAAHRLGDLDRAEGAYVSAWLLDPASPYPLRGLESLEQGRPARLVAALERVLEARPHDTGALDALVFAEVGAKDGTAALLALERRIALDEKDPAGWLLGGRVFLALEQWEEARKHVRRALDLDPTSAQATALFEELARTVMARDRERGIAFYEEILRLRPGDPYVRNNYGFLLREIVSPFTAMGEDGLQTLVPGAPPRIRELLVRCRDVYAEAVAAIPESRDRDLDERTAWSLAGVINDYGLIVHYFVDVQDPLEAERQYLRALRMTDYAFKDTYVPNLRRLYTKVLPDRDLARYRVARQVRDAVLAEVPRADGGFDLVPDEEKRAVAEKDVEEVRARLYRTLEEGADEDGAPWPPPPPSASGSGEGRAGGG